MSDLTEGNSPEAFLAQVTMVDKVECFVPKITIEGEMERKRGSDAKKSLFYFDKAVELNDYDETALVARSRWVNSLGMIFKNFMDQFQVQLFTW